VKGAEEVDGTQTEAIMSNVSRPENEADTES